MLSKKWQLIVYIYFLRRTALLEMPEVTGWIPLTALSNLKSSDEDEVASQQKMFQGPGSPALQADSLPTKLWGKPCYRIQEWKWQESFFISHNNLKSSRGNIKGRRMTQEKEHKLKKSEKNQICKSKGQACSATCHLWAQPFWDSGFLIYKIRIMMSIV